MLCTDMQKQESTKVFSSAARARRLRDSRERTVYGVRRFTLHGPLQCMYAVNPTRDPKLFGYTKATKQSENDSDVAELFKMASKNKARLVVFGGLHGYKNTGEPTGQSTAEKAVCSFSFNDVRAKGPGTGINFTYNNLAKYTTNGSDVKMEKQVEIAKLIQDYLDKGWYVLLSWCYSSIWAQSMGIK